MHPLHLQNPPRANAEGRQKNTPTATTKHLDSLASKVAKEERETKERERKEMAKEKERKERETKGELPLPKGDRHGRKITNQNKRQTALEEIATTGG